MAFARLSAIVALAFATVQVANAGLTRRVTCASGQVTSNAACCGQICPLFCYCILMSCLQPFSQSSTRSRRISLTVASAVKRFVKKKHVCRARSPFSTLNRLTPLFAWLSTTPSGSPLMASSVLSIPCLSANPMMYFRWKVSNLADARFVVKILTVVAQRRRG